MKPNPLAPRRRSRMEQLRPLALLLALGAGLYFTEPGRATLNAVKEHFTGSSAQPEGPGGVQVSDALQQKAAATEPQSDSAPVPPLPAASASGGVDIAVPVPDLPDEKALAAKAASAAAAAASAASAAAAAEEARVYAEKYPPWSSSHAALRAAPAPERSLQAYLRDRAAVEAAPGPQRGPTVFEAPSGDQPPSTRTEPVKPEFRALAAPAKRYDPADGPPSPFAGVWEGRFNGIVVGELLLVVDPRGDFRMTVAIDNRARLFEIAGHVTAGGQLSFGPRPLMGPLGLFQVYGQFKDNEAFGGWSPGSGMVGGSWRVERR